MNFAYNPSVNASDLILLPIPMKHKWWEQFQIVIKIYAHFIDRQRGLLEEMHLKMLSAKWLQFGSASMY